MMSSLGGHNFKPLYTPDWSTKLKFEIMEKCYQQLLRYFTFYYFDVGGWRLSSYQASIHFRLVPSAQVSEILLFNIFEVVFHYRSSSTQANEHFPLVPLP
jgi:hypothetical protein